MNESQDAELTRFMKAVERKESRVYHEDKMNSREILYMLAPIVVGVGGSIIGLFGFILVGTEKDFLLLLLLLGSPLGIGVAVTFVIAFKLDVRVAQYGLKGVTRSLLSITILFLDMLLEGYVDIGSIEEPSSPEEFSRYSSIGFSATNFALKKLNPESYKIHAQLLKEKKQSNTSSREKLFMRFVWLFLTLIFGTLIVVMVLQTFNLIAEDLALIILYSFSIMGVLVVCMLGVHLRRTMQKGPSEEVERAILEPDLRTENRLILDRLLGTLVSEGEHPLRVLTISEYVDLTYTGNTYMTSRGIMLREAILIPRRFIS